MGRPPIGKKPMTAAERQRRRRKRLARDERHAEKRARSAAGLAKSHEHAKRLGELHRAELIAVEPPTADLADELVAQLLEAIQLTPDVTLTDIRNAIDRRLDGVVGGREGA